jgi:N-acetylmuramoyl-L-alanine amidase
MKAFILRLLSLLFYRKQEEAPLQTKEVLVPVGHPNRPGTKLTAVKALVFHYTGNEAPAADAVMNAKYFGRAWGGTEDKPTEGDQKTPFRYGSTQIICDHTQIVIAIPENEAAWAAGDRPLPFDPVYKGQQKLAKAIFDNKQNFQSISIEICNNDAIRNSDADWKGACKNAIAWAVDYCKRKGLKIQKDLDTPLARNGIYLLRHYDLTTKKCPKPMIDDPDQWWNFCEEIMEKVGTV